MHLPSVAGTIGGRPHSSSGGVRRSTALLASALVAVPLAAAAGGTAHGDAQVPLPEGREITDVAFIDADTATAVGDDGAIWRTADGGVTWAVQDSGTTQQLTEVSFTDINTGAVVAEDGAKWRTVDGGQTWSPLAASDDDAATLAAVSERWVARFDGPANDFDVAQLLGVRPDGSRAFVSGSVQNITTRDWATIAYDGTGSESWATLFDGHGFGDSPNINGMGVSPDGSTVFVTGGSIVDGTAGDYATVAYDADDGAVLWDATYDGSGSGHDRARALAVSADGDTVFVTGNSRGVGDAFNDYATIAYDATTGAEVWAARYDGPATTDNAFAVTLSPSGDTVFVTGGSVDSGTHFDYATVAYDADDGSELWVARYNGPGNFQDIAFGLGSDGSRVFVAGESQGAGVGFDYATIAYDVTTGAQLWVSRYNGPAGGSDSARPTPLVTDGSRVYVTGGSQGTLTGTDYATVAYDVTDGTEEWVSRYDGPAHGADSANAIELVGASPNLPAMVLVTGQSVGVGTGLDYATVAYHTDGTERWVTRYNGAASGPDQAWALGAQATFGAVTVHVTGSSGGTGTINDYATVAYEECAPTVCQ